MIMTEEIIIQGRHGQGGWNKEQFRILGVEWPQKTGWIRRLIGKEIDDSVVKEFLAMRGMTIKKVRRLKREALQ